MAHDMLKEKRATRGLRMGALVGEAANEDEQFWAHETWGEDDSGNESFSEEEIKPDEFDSDFNDSEDDGEDEDEEGEIERERREIKASKNVYKDPSAGRRPVAKAAKPAGKLSFSAAMAAKSGEGGGGSKRKRDEESGSKSSGSSDEDDSDASEGDEDEEKDIKSTSSENSSDEESDDDSGDDGLANVRKSIVSSSNSSSSSSSSSSSAKKPRLDFADQVKDLDLTAERSVRHSTKSRSEETESIRKKDFHAKKNKPRLSTAHFKRFTQQQLLDDALLEEEKNQKWLEKQKLDSELKAIVEKPKKAQTSCYRKLLSRRGTYPTITFTDVDNMPPIFSLPTPKEPLLSLCVVTGERAKYRDPLTNEPYATVAAFKEIRRRHRRQLQAANSPRATEERLVDAFIYTDRVGSSSSGGGDGGGGGEHGSLRSNSNFSPPLVSSSSSYSSSSSSSSTSFA